MELDANLIVHNVSEIPLDASQIILTSGIWDSDLPPVSSSSISVPVIISLYFSSLQGYVHHSQREDWKQSMNMSGIIFPLPTIASTS